MGKRQVMDMFRQSIKSLLFLIAGAVMGGCASSATTKPTLEQGEEVAAAAKPAAAVAAPVIVEIVSRDSRIVVRATNAGPSYSVRGASGEVIVPEMSLPAMQASHPDLARRIGTMNASAGNTAWAGVE